MTNRLVTGICMLAMAVSIMVMAVKMGSAIDTMQNNRMVQIERITN